MKKLLFLLVIAGCAGLMQPASTQAQTPSSPRSASLKQQGSGAEKPSALSPRHNELGKPLLTAWLPKDYGAEASNWAIVQDDRGVMYFGNTSGILEYDGVSWRLIQFPNRSVYRSLAKDAKNRIYAGGVGDFGYLVLDRIGQFPSGGHYGAWG